ncbi:hypothetical protein SAMN05446037_10423 [Anaerovirgula multivorans]|uniref:Uncharacterized protein n=1 Tax=Anaerovirgula multivorans TaxID=312168 RepID=A0A239K221_9FIRM|nr:hypothetical protein [Anaerovirgula multivorans]SNT12081.1 hypothetical protein SAMN05446037_10423 [Anaerovirgula multivorans]
MVELLAWIKDYSPIVAVFLAIGTATIFILKNAVERSIYMGFESYASRLSRRSSFEEKVLLDRFTLIINFTSRLERLMTNLNRLHSGHTVSDGFIVAGEMIPLTEIFEDLEQSRIVLTEDFHEIFLKQAKLALRAANTKDDLEWKNICAEWTKFNEALRINVEKVFKISEIKW